MKNVTIWTPYDCIVYINGQSVNLSRDSHLTVNENEEIIIKKGQQTFKIDLYKPLVDYCVIEKEDRFLVFLLDGQKIENAFVSEYKYNNIKSSIEVFPSKIIFSSSNRKKIVSFEGNIEDVECGNIKHIDYVIYSFDNQKNLLAYNVKNFNARLFKGQKISINENEITIENKNYHCNYFIDDEGLKIKSSSCQRRDSSLVVYDFFESIKNSDYARAQSLLSNELKNQISIESIKEFVGDVKYYYLIDENTCFAITNNKAKLFELKIEGNKIQEIND